MLTERIVTSWQFTGCGLWEHRGVENDFRISSLSNEIPLAMYFMEPDFGQGGGGLVEARLHDP